MVTLAADTIVFDPAHTGHHLNWVRMCIEAFEKMGRKVIFATSEETLQSAEYAVFLKRCAGQFDTLGLPCRAGPGMHSRIDNAWWLLRLLVRSRAQLVFVPFLDNVFYTLGVPASLLGLFGVRFGRTWGCLMYCGFAHRQANRSMGTRLMEWICRTVIRFGPFARVLLTDEIAHDYLKTRNNSSRLRLCPDPVDTPSQADGEALRRKLGIPAGAKVIGAFGVLSEAKGIERLVRTFLDARSGEDDFLLLMGRQTPGLSSALERILSGAPASKNVVVVNRFVDDQVLLDGIDSVDVVAVAYAGHICSASFLMRAVAAGKPVLGSKGGWIGHVMRKYGLGYVCDPFDEASLMAGVRWALGGPKIDMEGARRLAAMNTIERFQEVLMEGPHRQSQARTVAHAEAVLK